MNRQAQRLVRIRKTVVVPLSNARGVIGTLSVFNRAADFDQADARVLQRLADHVAVAIVNARLYEELAESSREWTVAFNAIPTGMAVMDDDGRIVRYNSRALQLGHFETHRELVGRQFYEAVLGDSRAIGMKAARCTRRFTTGCSAARRCGREARGCCSTSLHCPIRMAARWSRSTTSPRRTRMAEQNRLVLDDRERCDPRPRSPASLSRSQIPAASELHVSRRSRCGTLLSGLVAPELTDELEAQHRGITRPANRDDIDAMFVRADGERRQVSVSQAALRDVHARDRHRGRDS